MPPPPLSGFFDSGQLGLGRTEGGLAGKLLSGFKPLFFGGFGLDDLVVGPPPGWVFQKKNVGGWVFAWQKKCPPPHPLEPLFGIFFLNQAVHPPETGPPIRSARHPTGHLPCMHHRGAPGRLPRRPPPLRPGRRDHPPAFLATVRREAPAGGWGNAFRCLLSLLWGVLSDGSASF